jgi:nuclear transcription factor Y, gamma
MKIEEEVKTQVCNLFNNKKLKKFISQQMISAEAPVLLAKAAELFVRTHNKLLLNVFNSHSQIEELTLRSWLYTHENRRKTIQKTDVAAGAAKSEMFDFLIDILPREDGQKVGVALFKGSPLLNNRS